MSVRSDGAAYIRLCEGESEAVADGLHRRPAV